MDQTITTADTSLLVTKHGIKIQDGELSYPDWKGFLDGYRKIKTAYIEGLADLVSYGRRNFGDEQTEDALTQLEFPLVDANHAAAIGQTTLEFRSRHDLSAEHYYLLGKLPSEEEREHWATVSSANNLTALELKRSIEHGELLKSDEISKRSGRDSGGLMTVQALVFSFERWEKQIGGIGQVLKWEPSKRQKWLKEMAPLIRLADKVRSSLEGD